MSQFNRRQFIQTSAASVALASLGTLPASQAIETKKSGADLRIGLVTYLWGKDWDLPTIIKNCEKSKVLGVELRTQHKHGVEPTLSMHERKEVRKRFADSPVTLVGYGSNAQFHEDDPEKFKANVELTKSYIKLMHDCGGTGVKVKPNGFVKGVPHEKTIAQIGKGFREVAKFGGEYGQQIRVEVHGRESQELPNMAAMMKAADHANAKVCWNSNDADLSGKGLEYNFNLVKDSFGDTVHIREMNVGKYPYEKLMKLFVDMNYNGWILLECRTKQKDRVAAMIEQREILKDLVAKATPK